MSAVGTLERPIAGAAREVLEAAVVRLAGDSGDGIQLTGGQLTLATALAGNDLATFPDFPAEIRAPAGTTFGVSAFQINFGSQKIATAGDAPDVLIAMNPAALKVNIKDLRAGGTVFVDTGSFKERDLKKAARDLRKKLDTVEKKLYTPSSTRGIIDESGVAFSQADIARRSIESSWDRPTAAQLVALEQAEALAKTALAEVDRVWAEDVAAFRQRVEAAGIGLLP